MDGGTAFLMFSQTTFDSHQIPGRRSDGVNEANYFSFQAQDSQLASHIAESDALATGRVTKTGPEPAMRLILPFQGAAATASNEKLQMTLSPWIVPT